MSEALRRELPEFEFPEGDERFITGPTGMANNCTEEERETIRFMYSQFESSCGSVLEGRMGVGICIIARILGCDPNNIRQFVCPQHPVGWCKLDFLLKPFSKFPESCFAIECDGEKWHMDKAKDQRRDAWVLGQGIKKIYRYAGQQIYGDASWCVLDALTDFCGDNLRKEGLFK